MEFLLRSSADEGNTSTGGSLFKNHMVTYVLEEHELFCRRLSTEALVLYKAIVKFPIFARCEKSGKSPSFVAAIKEVCSVFNAVYFNADEIVSEIVSETIVSETGVACGGGGPEKMLKHAFLIASLQKFCIDHGKPISHPFDKVAVLSASLDTVVAHVINGQYVPVPAEAEA